MKKVIGVCFEVINELGGGFLESVYQKALVIALKQAGFDVGLLVNFGEPRLELKRLHRFRALSPAPA